MKWLLVYTCVVAAAAAAAEILPRGDSTKRKAMSPGPAESPGRGSGLAKFSSPNSPGGSPSAPKRARIDPPYSSSSDPSLHSMSESGSKSSRARKDWGPRASHSDFGNKSPGSSGDEVESKVKVKGEGLIRMKTGAQDKAQAPPRYKSVRGRVAYKNTDRRQTQTAVKTFGQGSSATLKTGGEDASVFVDTRKSKHGAWLGKANSGEMEYVPPGDAQYRISDGDGGVVGKIKGEGLIKGVGMTQSRHEEIFPPSPSP